MDILESIKYTAVHAAIGSILGGNAAVWADWMLWEWCRGPRSDHSCDYMAFVYMGIGSILGGIAGGTLAVEILKRHSG